MYAYVNQDWLTTYTDSSWSSAIALYHEGSTSFYGFFKYTDKNTVEYNGDTFLRENYPISYNLNGGTNDPENPSFYYGDQDITLREPTKIGYTFTGWSGTDISGTSKTVTIPKGSTGAKTYTANWQANTYTLTLNANGGECDADQMIVSYDAAFALPIPHRAGYTFSGWFHDSNKITDGVWTGTEDMELVAEWEPIEYSISYSLDGGTNNADNPSSYNAEDSAITLKYPVKEGYNFLGWSGTGLTDITKDVMIESGSIGDKTYTAHWEKVSYTITYHLNGGTNSQANPLTFTIDDLPLTLQPPTSSELEFWGWYTSEDFNAESKISQITAAENITLYARFYHKNDNGIVYRLNGDEFAVEKYEGTETEVVIPDTYSGAKVTSVSVSAFSGCNAVKSIVIPDSVTSIGVGAFTGCSSLEKITLPFVGTTSTAAGIPQQLFGYVFGTVQYDNSTRITQYTVSGPDGSMRYYRYYLPNSLRQVTITSYDIPNYAFYNCSMIKEISFGSGVKAIGESAFAYSGLLQAEIPDTITSLGRMEAFAYCRSLTKVVIGKGITEIPWSTFSNCTALSDITLSENVTEIGRSAFYNCANLKTIVIPSGITDIGDSAFERCGSLSAIYFGGGSLSDWDKINIANHNDELNSATVYCYSEIAPTSDGNYDMSRLFENTLTGLDPACAVPFVDNHDTQPGQALASFIPAWFKPLAYALILLRDAGIPCVFYGDYYGIPHDRLAPVPGLGTLMKARELYAYGKENLYFDDPSVVGFTREGDGEHPDSGAAVLLTDSVAGRKRMYVGRQHAGKLMRDVRGEIPEAVAVGSDGWAEFSVGGGSVSVWLFEKAAERLYIEG